ncbi:MAG: phospholipase D-like domain-containing protein [Kofleriaceae bacterium]
MKALVLIALTACSPALTGDDDIDSVPDPDADSDLAAQPYVSTAPHLEAVFALPGVDGTPDHTIEKSMNDMIDATPKGARIRLAVFGFKRTNVATHLIDAYKRGVDVQIVLDRNQNYAHPAPDDLDADEDDDNDLPSPETDPGEVVDLATGAHDYNDATQMLLDHLPHDAVTLCTRGHGSCIGDHINHSKIWLFSSTGGANHVVVQSSANVATLHLHNNSVISRGDRKLYNDYVAYFADLAAHQEDLNYYRIASGDHTIAYHFPRGDGLTGDDHDTVANILDKVRCNGASHHTVYVTMAYWHDRPQIDDRLVALKRAGCDVRINMRHGGTKGVSKATADRFVANHLDVAFYPTDGGTNIHSKILIVDAIFGDDGDRSVRQLVWMGSHNFNNDALTSNDETILRVDNPGVFDAYVANWKAIRAQIDSH